MSDITQDTAASANCDGDKTGIVYRWQGYKGDIKPETFETFKDKDVVTADVGSDHYLFLTREQQVFACGSNKRGQLGISSHEEHFPEPVLIESLSDKNVVSVVCGYFHSAAVCENGDVYCWGETCGGECGTGKEDAIIAPEKVEFAEAEDQSPVRIRQVACGQNHTLALSYDGEIWAWGSGVQLGVKDITIATRPILVDRLIGRTVLAIYCGEKHSVALVEWVSATSPEPSRTSLDRKFSLNQKSSSDDDVSNCEACNEEMFSFTETIDTCIISDKRKCLIESEMSPTDFSAITLAHTCRKGRGSQSDTYDQDKSDSEDKTGDKPSPSSSGACSGNSMGNKVKCSAPSVLNESSRGTTVSRVTKPADSVDDDNDDSDLLGREEKAGDSVKSKSVEQVTSLSLETESAQSSEDQPDEVSPVWKLRPEFEGRADALETVDKGASVTPSGKIVRSPSSLLDSSKARQYLAKQLEDVETSAPKKKAEKMPSDPPDSPSISAMESMISSTVVSGMQQVTNITSKAFSSFRSIFGDMDSMEKEIGQDLSHVPIEKESKGGSTSASVAESSFSNPDETDSIMSKSVNSLNLSPESPRRNAFQSEGDSPSQSDTRKHAAVLQDHQSRECMNTIETEIWTWGKNNKGQLGHGDMGDRNYPCCIKMLSSKNIVKVAAGDFHTLALTASSQVYSWGDNTSGQLGHSEAGPTPTKMRSLSSYPVWDIAGGHKHSLLLVDSTGFMPDVCYCGKQPSEGVYAPVVKTAKPVGLTFLKKAQTGWIRRVITKGDNCLCLVDKNTQGGKATQFEFASTERTFNMLMLKIATQLTVPLKKSDFFSALEVEPYKLTLLQMLEAFIALTRKTGRSSVEMTTIIRDGGSIMSAQLLSNFEEFIIEFHNFSRTFCNFLAVGGFEYCAKLGSQFFDKSMPVFQDLLDFVSKNNHAQNFSLVMKMPFDRLKEYCRLTNKMTLNYPTDSTEGKHLVKSCLHWEGLRTTITAEYNMAETTRAFWDTLSSRIGESLRVPKRRLIKDSKTCPLSLFSAGRFSAHLFYLFDDTFVHVQGSSFQSYPLSIIWVDTPSETEQLRNVIVVTAPEETLTLCAPNPENKAEWLMALNQAINKVLANQKMGKKMPSSDRLTPPMIRHAKYKFLKGSFKDAVYKGYWMNGLMNGQGELDWPDGRRYAGKFKLGLQHGHGTLIIDKKVDGEELYEGNWKDGRMHGLGRIRYSNGDQYEGYLKDGMRFGHGVFKQGRYTSQAASVYIGEWFADCRYGYGVMDDVLKGEKYMGVWNEDYRHGPGIVVTLDGMYFEGNFFQNKLMGFGVMLTDDNSCYEGEFAGITQLSGKGVLTMPNGDRIEGNFSGSWNEGLKVNGTFHKSSTGTPPERKSFRQDLGIRSSYYGKLCLQAREKWGDIFNHCQSLLGYNGVGKPDTTKAWEVVAVMVSSGKRAIKEGVSQPRYRYKMGSLEELEKIPPHSLGKLSTEYYQHIRVYLQKAFDTPFHPLGKLIEALVDVFRVAYIGVGAHPRLLHHAVDEIRSYVKRVYIILRILFPDLPDYGGPKQIFPEGHQSKDIPKSTEEVRERLAQVEEEEEIGEIISPGGLLHPILLPKVYPPLFDLYALYNDKEDEKYWERVQRLNRQGDMALMAYLGIDQRFWLLDDSIFSEKRKSLSTLKDLCYAEAVDTLQRLSTAFSPAEKLTVIEQTFMEISQAVQGTVPADNVWCMDDLFPIFQFVVVRSKIRHLGAEIHMIDDLMESHLEYGEFGLMFTTLKACYFQIQNEKLPIH